MNRVQEYAVSKGVSNVFQYGGAEEVCIFEPQAAEFGYKRRTTFFSDLSIAEWCGLASVRDTYNNVVKSWLNDVKYFTEFVLCLNWKSWEWKARGYEELSMLYVELYEQAHDLALSTYKDEELSYYLATTD